MRDIIIQGLSARQCAIADLLWACPTKAEADMLCRAGGVEFVVVRDMILAAMLDTVDQTDLANAELERIFAS